MSSLESHIDDNTLFKYSDDVKISQDFLKNGLKYFNENSLEFLMENFKYMKQSIDRSLCFSWKLSLNIFSNLEDEFMRLEDFSRKKYIIYSYLKQIWVPRCYKITEISILKNDSMTQGIMCSKDLPILFLKRDNGGKVKTYKGYINKYGIIHSKFIKEDCAKLRQMMVFEILNPNDPRGALSFLRIFRNGHNISLSVSSNVKLENIDPFNFHRNHFNYKFDFNMDPGLEVNSLDFLNIIEVKENVTEVLVTESQVPIENKYLENDTILLLVPLFTILSNFLLYIIVYYIRTYKKHIMIMKNYEHRLTFYKNL